MKRVLQNNGPMTRYSGYYKVSYNPMSFLINEIQKKIKKTD